MEEVDPRDELKAQEHYHFAMSGKSFAVIMEHFQDLAQKVCSYSLFPVGKSLSCGKVSLSRAKVSLLSGKVSLS